ncbi:hypothetical protein MYX76_15440 [Desulfobacterota bacterium AH_259_B03_O07]|nr:hypothetical protein [Desulfobacterota bacterium AH_259_B03_O07]
MKPDLNGKTVIVTGASSGIGREEAIILSIEKVNVAIAARCINNPDKV